MEKNMIKTLLASNSFSAPRKLSRIQRVVFTLGILSFALVFIKSASANPPFPNPQSLLGGPLPTSATLPLAFKTFPLPWPAPTLATYNVGVIPDSSGACPVNSPHITISMDDEDKNNASSVNGWVGQTSHYSTGTNFQFCKVDGTLFQPLAATDYIVLKLGTVCPAGSYFFSRSFDNEDKNPHNTYSGDISPNQSSNSPSQTILFFCYFPKLASGGASFPNLGVPYGVFAKSSSLSLSTGYAYTDDEDKNNADSSYIPLYTNPIFNGVTSIIYGSDALGGGRNSILLMAKVK
jgi:hypothetical protein